MACGQRRKARLEVEGLESRNLLSVTTQFSETLVNGVPFGTLTIIADRDNNRLAVVEQVVDVDTSAIDVVGFENTGVFGFSRFFVQRPSLSDPNFLALETG